MRGRRKQGRGKDGDCMEERERLVGWLWVGSKSRVK